MVGKTLIVRGPVKTVVVRVPQKTIRILAGRQGVAGTPGAAGQGSGAPRVQELLVSATIPTEFILSDLPMPGSLGLYINGLRQASNAFSFIGTTVALPAELEIAIGDLLIFSYMMN